MAFHKKAYLLGAATALLLGVAGVGGKLAVDATFRQELVDSLPSIPADRGEALAQAKAAAASLSAQMEVAVASLGEAGSSMAEWGAAARSTMVTRVEAACSAAAEWSTTARSSVAAACGAAADWAEPHVAAAKARITTASGAACEEMAAVKAQILGKAQWAAEAIESRTKELPFPLPSKEVVLAVTVAIAGCCLLGFWRRHRRSRVGEARMEPVEATVGVAAQEAIQVKEEAETGTLSIAARAPTPSRRRSSSPGMKKEAVDVIQLLNTGTYEDLVALRGIGPMSAVSILDYRKGGEAIQNLDELISKVGLKKHFVNSLAGSFGLEVGHGSN